MFVLPQILPLPYKFLVTSHAMATRTTFQALARRISTLPRGNHHVSSVSKGTADWLLRKTTTTRSLVTTTTTMHNYHHHHKASTLWGLPRLRRVPTTTSNNTLRCLSVAVLSNTQSTFAWHKRKNHVFVPRLRQQGQLQRRQASTWLPEALSSWTIWGGSGWMLKTLHMDGIIPFWACFAIINILVRFLLFPLVIQGAHASSRFAKVVPEVQFLVTLFTNDLKQMQTRKASFVERMALMRTNFQTLGGIYKLHKINPLAVFLSPLLQLPIFWYLSVDLRKIVNGLDPQLAQQLVESPVAWIPDLTEADPWYGLPVLAGLLLYANVEVAVGKRSLAGPNTAKADTGVLLKDIFQSFGVFMPCFTSQMPAGVQIYVATSFLFTMGQSAALRDATFRSLVGLPPMTVPDDSSLEPKYAKEFIRLKQLEQKAREIRGNGPVLGKGVLALDFECSFPGNYRKSTIDVSNGSGLSLVQVAADTKSDSVIHGWNGAPSSTAKTRLDVSSSPFAQLPFVPGVSAPPWQLAEQRHLFEPPPPPPPTASANSDALPDFSDQVMAKANRGEMPVPIKLVDTTSRGGNKPRVPLRVNRKGKKGGKKKR